MSRIAGATGIHTRTLASSCSRSGESCGVVDNSRFTERIQNPITQHANVRSLSLLVFQGDAQERQATRRQIARGTKEDSPLGPSVCARDAAVIIVQFFYSERFKKKEPKNDVDIRGHCAIL